MGIQRGKIAVGFHADGSEPLGGPWRAILTSSQKINPTITIDRKPHNQTARIVSAGCPIGGDIQDRGTNTGQMPRWIGVDSAHSDRDVMERAVKSNLVQGISISRIV